MLFKVRVTLFAGIVCAVSTGVVQAQCQYSQQQLAAIKLQRDAYAQNLSSYCSYGAAICQQVRQDIARYDQILAQCQNARPTPQPPPKTEDECERQRRTIRENAERSRNMALNFVSRTRPGRNGGFEINYSRPPIYCGDTQYTRSPRPYYVNSASGEVVRVINQLCNNGNRIDQIKQW